MRLKKGNNIYNISTRAFKNKLIFKFYRNQIKPLDLIEFINQRATSFNKHLYVILAPKNIKICSIKITTLKMKKLTLSMMNKQFYILPSMYSFFYYIFFNSFCCQIVNDIFLSF